MSRSLTVINKRMIVLLKRAPMARVSMMEESVLWVTSSLTLPRTTLARPTEFGLFQFLNDGDKEKI